MTSGLIHVKRHIVSIQFKVVRNTFRISVDELVGRPYLRQEQA